MYTGTCGNDLWTSFSNTSLCRRDCSDWAKIVRLAQLRGISAGHGLSVQALSRKTSCQEKQNRSNFCHAVEQSQQLPRTGLFDEFYAHVVKCRETQLACSKRLQRCGANVCSCTGNWITVYGFPPEAGDDVLQFFFSLGRTCDKRLAKGNWFHLAYVNSVDCWRAERFNELPILSLNRMRVGVRRWNRSQLDRIENVNQCEGGMWQKTPMERHWGRKIMQL